MSDTPKTAAEAEVTGDDTIVVDWHTYKLTVPASADHWSIDAMESFTNLVDASEAGEVGAFRHIAGFLKSILGNAQWSKVRKGAHNKASDASNLFETVLAAYGEAKSGE